jgi:hypothetical protein
MLEETNLHCYVHCDTWQLAYFQSVIKVVLSSQIDWSGESWQTLIQEREMAFYERVGGQNVA